MRNKVAYLGPSGTFCEEAVRNCDPEKHYEPVAYESVEAVMRAVDQKLAARGVVPIENSCEGSVNSTLDLLTRNYDVKIAAEIILPVQHCLMIHPAGDESGIRCLMSHGQALAQCSHYLDRHYPGIELVETGSTAEACRRVAEGEPHRAAIGPRGAAALYGLKLIAEGIEDFHDNETRFVVLSQEDAPPTGNDKTSILLYLTDRPGALYDILGEFARLQINLTKIESRPSRSGNWDYLFFIDFCGHHHQPEISRVLGAIAAQARYLKVLGSYPKWQRQQ